MPVEVLLVERDAAAIDVRLIQKLSKASSVTVSITAENDGEAALGILADPQFKPALVITNMIQAKVGAPNLIERCVEKRIPVVVFGGCENSRRPRLSRGALFCRRYLGLTLDRSLGFLWQLLEDQLVGLLD